MTLSDIAGWLRLSWDTVKAVVKGRLEKDYRRIGYRRVRQIPVTLWARHSKSMMKVRGVFILHA